MEKLPPAILLMGPTASGKTAAAMTLADRFPVELISVDSAQVFRDMNIGTAKPDAETLKAYPHHLIDLISPEEAYSTARFRADALAVMADISARGRIPLLVGGTMLYFKALMDGLDDLPTADPAVARITPNLLPKLSLLFSIFSFLKISLRDFALNLNISPKSDDWFSLPPILTVIRSLKFRKGELYEGVISSFTLLSKNSLYVLVNSFDNGSSLVL